MPHKQHLKRKVIEAFLQYGAKTEFLIPKTQIRLRGDDRDAEFLRASVFRFQKNASNQRLAVAFLSIVGENGKAFEVAEIRLGLFESNRADGRLFLPKQEKLHAARYIGLRPFQRVIGWMLGAIFRRKSKSFSHILKRLTNNFYNKHNISRVCGFDGKSVHD